MGVYIKGMKKPKNCDLCPMRQINLARCQLTGRSTSHYTCGRPIQGVPIFCPLEEVKTPHDRLISSGYLKDEINKMKRGSTELQRRALNMSALAIDRAPTVIEAEDQ